MKKKEDSAKPTTKVIVKRWLVPALSVLLVIILGLVSIFAKKPEPAPALDVASEAATLSAENITLPNPDFRSSNSVEAVLKNRRTRRNLLDKSLSLKQVSQMLWAAQGVTVDWGGRTAPSAKSTYPLSIFLITSKVDGLDPGEYQYIPGDRAPVHKLKPIKKVDLQEALYEAVNDSAFINAPAVMIITGNMGKMAEAYGGIPRDKEVYLEAGHAAQNLYLQAESLRLGLSVITSFADSQIRDLVTIPDSETIIYLIPLGIPKP